MLDILAKSLMTAAGNHESDFTPWERRIETPTQERIRFRAPKEVSK